MADQYKNTRPVSSRILRLSAPKLRENFRKLEEVIGEGHEFTTGGAQTGKHVAPTFKSLSEDPSQPTATDEVKLYNKGGTLATLKSDGSKKEYYSKDEADGKYAHRSNNLSDVDNAATSRDNLGLGSAAVEDKDTLVPPGIICMWSGSTNSIPSGWALCDGANGTPNLRDRFVIGAGGDRSVGETSDGQMPSHNHSGPSHTHGNGTLSTGSAGVHTHDVRYRGSGHTRRFQFEHDDTGGDYASDMLSSDGAHTHPVSGNTGSAGTGNTGSTGSGTEVIAKYYALAYIMKL